MDKLYVRPEVLARACGATMPAAQRWCAPLNDGMRAFDIGTVRRAASFLAQTSYASDRLVRVRETWIPTDEQDSYEGWRALGNTEPGDGRRFKGRGLLPIVGRSNYRACRNGLRVALPGAIVPDFEAHPVFLEWPRWAAYSAGWWWQSRGLNEVADGGTDEAFVLVTRILCGGLAGIEERRVLWAGARAALGA